MSVPCLAALIVAALSLPGVSPATPSPQPPAAQSDRAVLPEEWLLLDKTASDVLTAVRAELLAAGFRLARDRREDGLLVTRRQRYDPRWPSAADLRLPPSQVPKAVTVHAFVAPGFTPARLAISVIVDVEETIGPLKGRKGKGTLLLYGYAALSSYFASRIADRVGTDLTPLEVSAEGRAAQVQSVPSSPAPGCGPAVLLPKESTAAPVLVSQVKPIYPSPDLARRAGGAVLLKGEVTEHGTLSHLHWAGGIEDTNLVAAARGAATLWRFRAPVVDGCPARRGITIEMSFMLVR